MNYILIESELRGCLRHVTVPRRVRGVLTFLKENVGCRLRVRIGGRKVKVVTVRELEKGKQQEYKVRLSNRLSMFERKVVSMFPDCKRCDCHSDVKMKIKKEKEDQVISL